MHAERLRSEINKRRHRIEIECANELGLIAPWRRTRFRTNNKPVKVENEGLVNPHSISLNYGSAGNYKINSPPKPAIQPGYYQDSQLSSPGQYDSFEASGSKVYNCYLFLANAK
jgi:hypothetical protein